MTAQATAAPTEETAFDALDQIAAEAESEEAAQQQAEQAAEGEWEDVDAHREQALAIARMGVQGVEFLAGLIHPGHSLDANARAQGEANLFPIAEDFAGEMPEWMLPYVKYLGAGMWIGGVFLGAVQARRAEEAEAAKEAAAKEEAEQGAAHGV